MTSAAPARGGVAVNTATGSPPAPSFGKSQTVQTSEEADWSFSSDLSVCAGISQMTWSGVCVLFGRYNHLLTLVAKVMGVNG